jgi:hypothetical protein
MANMIFSALIAVLPLLASCAGSGLYYMSDEWCANHPNATPARCPASQEQRTVVRND